MTQAEKAERFRALHQREGLFLIPNPWDVGTARLLEHAGFEALASTSMGYAFTEGRPDGTIDRERMMAHLAALSAGTALPISADLGNGWGDAPAVAAETIRMAAAAGVVGGSIEDDGGGYIYAKDLAVERVRAAVEAARSLPFPFTLTARAENFLHNRPDLKDTIERLQAYQEAGADVLYAPGLATEEDIAAVVRNVDRPVNVLMGSPSLRLDVAQLQALGVKRVSVGPALMRAALGAFQRAAKEMREQGTFAFSVEAPSSRELTAIFSKR